ncbi:MAG: DUF5828 family protein [Candidatus Nanohaloarchaea archaeon]|nr:DUF5828 family protein [Candidatus Nanohaloarchaea archaeon]
MEESRFELVEEGEWEDVVAFSREVSTALATVSDQDHAAFEAWRPKEGEGPEAVGKRTVDGESIGTTRMEEESDGARTELSRAGRDARDSGSELVKGRPRESVRKAESAGNSTAKGVIPMLAKLVRGVERGIYTTIVEPTNPDYFESDTLSASIERIGLRRRRYRCRIIFEERETCSAVVDAMDG